MKIPTYTHIQIVVTAAAVTVAPCRDGFADKCRLGDDFALAMGFAH